ncbi:MAG: hypothetical protein ACE5MH_05820 [Terriglobia bacterium]
MGERKTYCDACQREVSPEHLQWRIHRIQLASRYRPFRIEILFLGETPPLKPEDYFYAETEKTGLSQALFVGLMEALKIRAENTASALKEFQKRDAFFADVLECPVEELASAASPAPEALDWAALVNRYGSGVLTRIRHSYRPAWIIPISRHLHRHFVPQLQATDLASRLLLYEGEPLPFPHPHNAVVQEQFRSGVQQLLAQIHRAKTG